jgi:hypothetical protein
MTQSHMDPYNSHASMNTTGMASTRNCAQRLPAICKEAVTIALRAYIGTKQVGKLRSSTQDSTISAHSRGFCRFHGCLIAGWVTAVVLALPSLPTVARLRAASALSFDGMSPPLPATTIKVLEAHGRSLTFSICAMSVQSDIREPLVRRMSAPSMSHRTIGRGTAFSIRFDAQKRYGKSGVRDSGMSL